MPTLRLLPIFAAILTLECTSPLRGAHTAVDAVSDLYTATSHALVADYERQQEACLDREDVRPAACVVEVRTAWRPVREAALTLYQAVLAAQAAVHAADAAEALGRQPDTARALAAVAAAVDAADRLRAAIDAMRGGR